MSKRKIPALILNIILLSALLIQISGPRASAAGPTLTVTLSDNAVVRNDRMTFDVRARNSAGKKIVSTVTLNGKRIDYTWDDSDKTSYTLVFSKAGENTVEISATADGGKKKSLTYHITYKPARKGEIIGYAVWSVEVFTLGCGYLAEPVSFPIRAGESAAAELISLLYENGLIGYYSGSTDEGFYLAYIADGTASDETYNGYKKSDSVKNPRKLELYPSVPEYLLPHLKSGMDFFDAADYQKNWEGHLGEFVISNGSGWMYCVNNNFPNVGFSDMYLSDGDVVRVQFTLGYGADIGGAGALGGQSPGAVNQAQAGYYPVANKDSLTKQMAKARTLGLMTKNNVKAAYDNALSAAAKLNCPQADADRAEKALKDALDSPDGIDNIENPESDISADTASQPAITEITENPEAGESSENENTEHGQSQSNKSDTAAPITQNNPDAPENAEDGMQASKQENVTGKEKADSDTAQASQNDDRKIRPLAAVAISLTALAAAYAIIFIICLCRKKTPKQNTDDKERR